MNRMISLVLVSCLSLAGCMTEVGAPGDGSDTSETADESTVYTIENGPIWEKQGVWPANTLTTLKWDTCWYENDQVGLSTRGQIITYPQAVARSKALVQGLINSRSPYPYEFLSCYNTKPQISFTQAYCSTLIPLSECM